MRTVITEGREATAKTHRDNEPRTREHRLVPRHDNRARFVLATEGRCSHVRDPPFRRLARDRLDRHNVHFNCVWKELQILFNVGRVLHEILGSGQVAFWPIADIR